MPKPKIVLSKNATFFSGNIEAVFKKAAKNGIGYLEILPYRWTTPEQILKLERKYRVEVAGVHLPEWWGHSLRSEINRRRGLIQKLLGFVWFFYIGTGSKSPGLKIMEALRQQGRNPYLLLHSNLVSELPKETLQKLVSRFFVAVENIPIQEGKKDELWNPVAVKERLKTLTTNASVAFDHGHLEESRKISPAIDPISLYRQTSPRVFHVGYNDYKPIYHALPNKQNQKKLMEMFRIHRPEYIVLETNPLVSVRKGKAMLEKLISEAEA